MAQVIFEAIDEDENIRLGIGHPGDVRQIVDVKKLPRMIRENVVGNGVFVTAVDVSIEGGKPLGGIHVWTNTLKELKVGKIIVDDTIESNGIRVTKER